MIRKIAIALLLFSTVAMSAQVSKLRRNHFESKQIKSLIENKAVFTQNDLDTLNSVYNTNGLTDKIFNMFFMKNGKPQIYADMRSYRGDLHALMIHYKSLFSDLSIVSTNLKKVNYEALYKEGGLNKNSEAARQLVDYQKQSGATIKVHDADEIKMITTSARDINNRAADIITSLPDEQKEVFKHELVKMRKILQKYDALNGYAKVKKAYNDAWQKKEEARVEMNKTIDPKKRDAAEKNYHIAEDNVKAVETAVNNYPTHTFTPEQIADPEKAKQESVSELEAALAAIKDATKDCTSPVCNKI